MLLRIFLDAVIREMRETIIDVVQRILIVSKAKIALLIEPYFGRGEVLDEDPLPDIELPSLNEQWVFDVFLYDKLSELTKGIISDII